MPQIECGFKGIPGGAQAPDLLVENGLTVYVNIGFDPLFNPNVPYVPAPGLAAYPALVDTGALESCIDSALAQQLGLPIIDRKPISGAHGRQDVNIHLAQIYIPGLGHTIFGAFAGVHLTAGGQSHRALLGRTFLRHMKLSYDGQTGAAVISR